MEIKMKVSKKDLFLTYNIDETRNIWKSIDNWMSVEIYRLLHNGNLPPQDDLSIKWVLDFLNKSVNDKAWWIQNVMSRDDWGSLYLTAKRMVYTLSDKLLEEINNK